MKETIDRIRASDEKIRVVLNKADCPTQQLVRIYGALMWSLGKVFQTPEVLRVYVGSFWDKPLVNEENKELMALEEKDLLSDLRTLPHNVAIRKVNELIKRARRAKIHATIILHLKSKVPTLGKAKAQKKMLEKLGDEFKEVMETHGVPKNDFPNMKRFRETLSRYEIHKFPKMKKDRAENLENMLSGDMPKLMSMVPSEIAEGESGGGSNDVNNPFAFSSDLAQQAVTWAVKGAMKSDYTVEFTALPQTGKKVSGNDARTPLLKHGLQPDVCSQVWAKSDMDGDGWLDVDEWCVARFIIDSLKAGTLETVPERLPNALIPPSKRYLFRVEGSTE